MVIKIRSIPLKILILRALLRRLRKNHPLRRQISEELSRREAGFLAEESLDLEIDRFFNENNMIFHDLNLSDGGIFYQIDNLLISSKLILIIEVKNMTGTLIFDSEHEQFIQRIGDNEKGYPDPISQVQRHQSYIKKLLAEHNLPPISVDYLIVINNPYAVLEFNGTSSEIRKRVCKYLSFQKRACLIEKAYIDEILSAKEFRKLCRLLLKKNTPPTNFIFKKYGIQKSDLLTGIHCPECSYLPLNQKNRKWYCPSCKSLPKNALVESLQDYFLLFDKKITNQQFRSFAHIDSIDTAKRKLQSAKLIPSGKNKLRTYSPSSIPW